MGNNNTKQASKQQVMHLQNKNVIAPQQRNYITTPAGMVYADILGDKYSIGKKIYRSIYTTTTKGICRATGEQVVMEFIPKDYVAKQELERAKRWFEAIKSFQHPNVIKYFELIDSIEYLVIIMEYVDACDLYSHVLELSDKGLYTELQVGNIIRQIAEGVTAVSELGIFLTELQPDHILCYKSEQKEVAKISTFIMPDLFMVLTPRNIQKYTAPEALKMEEEPLVRASVWCIGVLAYTLLCGYTPFSGINREHYIQNVMNEDYKFHHPEWTSISASAKDFINLMLVADADHRPTIAQCLEHKWLSGIGSNHPPLLKLCIKAIVKNRIPYHGRIPENLERTLDQAVQGTTTIRQATISLGKQSYIRSIVQWKSYNQNLN